MLTLIWPGHTLEIWYSPRHGYRPSRLLKTVGGVERVAATYPPMDTRKMKKRVIGTDPASMPGHLAAMESTLFGSMLNIIKHLAVTKYEDGTPRTPGKVFLSTLGTAYVVTFKEPDANAELPVTGATLDDALALGDLLLGSEDAPWQVDKWALSRAPKKGRN